ncbi:hypothetical protein [Streptomyces longispororuber]|uniref:hypothetical protein n=1 Tax=Streptomyces longispororuber TaxID=68230 RepID=UPI00167DACBD|nr:hypothetical protein [Streptomyces longispororuber]
MNATEQVTAPIYDRLIAEHGDVVADVARVAEQTRRHAAAVLDFAGAAKGGEDADGE